MTLGLGDGLSLALELLGERDVVEEDVWVVELVVPSALEVTHGMDQLTQLLIAHEGDQCGVGASRVFAVRGVIVLVGPP